MKRTFLLILALCGMTLAQAGTQLNIHQRSGGVVSYSFADKPEVSYQGEYLRVSTAKVSVDYPLQNLEEITFSDNASSIHELSTEGVASDIQVYTLDGRLLRTIPADGGVGRMSLSDLPQGTYVIKNGKTTYKINKQ